MDTLHHLYRADIYRLLALGFDEPTEETLATMRGIVADLLGTPSRDENSMWLREIDAQLSTVSLEEWSQLYLKLFVNEVLVPVSEGSYCVVERGAVVGDVSAFYQAFNMKVPESVGPPDQIRVELGFMCTMALKSANAIEMHMGSAVQVTQDAQKKFLEDHLGRWSSAFLARLATAHQSPLYQALSNLTHFWLLRECEAFQAVPIPYGNTTESETEKVVCPFAGGAACPAGEDI